MPLKQLPHTLQEPFASEQQLQCDSGGGNSGSKRRPWWLPLAYVTGSDSGGKGPSAATWAVLNSCSTGWQRFLPVWLSAQTCTLAADTLCDACWRSCAPTGVVALIR